MTKKIIEGIKFVIFGILYIYNAPILLVWLLISALGIEIKTVNNKELDTQSKIILLLIATVISTGLYFILPSFFIQI
jgi:hypothetical protein